MRIKHWVWMFGWIVITILLILMSVDKLSSWVQFADGLVMIYAAGEYIEKRPMIRKFIAQHHQHQNELKAALHKVHTGQQEIKQKHDQLHSKLKKGRH